jgi:phage gpG-like protein
MAEPFIRVDVETKGVNKYLRRIESRFPSQVKKALSAIGTILVKSIKRNFKVGGRPVKWKPLSPVTWEIRQKKGWTTPTPLTARGDLKNSINFNVTKDTVTVSPNKEYAAVQHFGAKKGSLFKGSVTVGPYTRRVPGGGKTTVRKHERRMVAPWGDIPARPFMLVQREDFVKIRRVLGKIVENSTRK